MLAIEEHETGGEEKIRPLSNVLAGQWTAGKSSTVLSPKNATDYRQVLDMRTGLLTTSWSQDIDGVHAKVLSETALLLDGPGLAQRWSIESNSYLELAFQAKVAGGKPKNGNRDDHSFEWTLPPSGMAVRERNSLSKDIRKGDPRADINEPWSVDGSNLNVAAAADSGQPFVFERVFTFKDNQGEGTFLNSRLAHNPASSLDAQNRKWIERWIFRSSGRPPRKFETFDEVKELGADMWAKRWQTDIEIDGPVEDQQAVRSFLFYLRSAIDPDEQMSVSPFGLSNDLYGGHVFWDADIWVFPALALIDPEAAKAIPRYRLLCKEAARGNFDAWEADGRPTATGKLGMRTLAGELFGYKYPWESSVTGKETVPGPSRFEEHISGSIAWSLNQAAALGLCDPAAAKAVIGGVGNYYRERASGNGIDGVMSPDESHTGANDLYTNLLAQWCVNGGEWSSPGLHGQGAHATYKLPHDNISFLTYDNDPVKSYKQAAAVLSIYPLQYPDAEKQAKVMMDRFADKTIKNGPAMTDSLHALIWARLGETDKAYETWQKSWKDFVREPHLQFSEKRNQTRTYFTTGAAGCLQTVLYGFLGFRIDSKKQDGALWSTKLALGRILSVKPNLPKEWKSVKFKNFTVMGRRYTLIASHNGVQVIQGDK